MTQKGYKRLTRFLLVFLFLIFVLLYFLISSNKDAGPTGGGWGNRERDMGTVYLSEIRSGGYILDQIPVPDSTTLGADDFDEQVVTSRAIIHNEGEETIKVTTSIYGTKQAEVAEINPGLHCGAYYYSGDTDPVADGDYRALLEDPAKNWKSEFVNLGLHTSSAYPMEFLLDPGETINLGLFFWTDAGEVPVLTDAVRNAYSITVKFTARTP